MPESLEDNQPAGTNDEDSTTRRPADLGGDLSRHLEIVHGDKIRGDKVAGDKITVSGDYVATQVIVQETTAVSIEDLPPEAGDPPYIGLHYFTASDANLFFGREELTARLVKSLHEAHYLFVVGASGSGKSSLIHAGVIPALEEQKPLVDGSLPPMGRWQTIALKPTERPLDSLATTCFPDREQLAERIQFRSRLDHDDTALREQLRRITAGDPAGRLLLVVDQFEELFTLCKAEEERRRFLTQIVTVIQTEELPLKTLLILRADFFAQCLRYETLSPLLERPTLIRAMSREEMRAAILQPLAAGEWSIQEGLDQEILDEIGDEPGGLPLLSHALLETWQRRRGRTLTLSGYQGAGKVQGAIAKTAETLYSTRLAGSEQQALAKFLFLEMVEPGANERDTRRRISLEQLLLSEEQKAAARELLDRLAGARLVTADRRTEDQAETYEVAHEALISNWERLRDWLDVEREQIRFRRQLQRDATEWEQNGGKSDYLYRGSKLALLEEEEGNLEAKLDPLSREFAAASIAQEQRRKRRRSALLVTAVAVAVVMVILASLAIIFAQSSQEQREIAQANAQEARANEQEAIRQRRGARTQALSASSLELNRQDPQLAALLALQAARHNQPGEQSASWMVDRALRGALNPQGTRFNQVLTHTAEIEGVQFSVDGRQLFVLGDDKQIVSWELAQLQDPPAPLPEAVPGINGIDAGCAGDALAMVQQQGALMLWDRKQQALASFASAGDDLYWTDVAVSSDGERIAAATESGPIYVWQTAAPADAPIELQNPDGSYAWAVAFVPDSSELLAAGNQGSLWLWSISGADAEPVPLIELEDLDWRAVAAAPDGSKLAAANDNGRVFLWDLSLGIGEGLVVAAHDNGAHAVAFSPDSRLLASAGGDGQIHLLDIGGLEAGTIISSTLPGHDQDIRSLAFSCAGDLLASGAGDRMVRLWNMTESPAAAQRLRVPVEAAPDRFNREVTSLHFRAGDQKLISAGRDGQVLAWDWQQNPAQSTSLTEGRDNPDTIRTDAAGGRVVTVNEEGLLTVQSSDGDAIFQAQLVTATEGQKGPVPALAADGQSVAVSAGVDNSEIRLWDLNQDGEGRLVGQHEDNVNQLLFMPGGRALVSASDDNTVRVWPLAGETLQPITLRGHTNTVEALAISADGLLAASGDQDHVILIWDLREPRAAIQRITRHDGVISALAFSEDGRLLASGDDRGTLYIWELDNLAEPMRLSAPEPANISSLAFAPEAAILAAGQGFEGEIVLWPTINKLAEIGCQVVGRNLTWSEWQRYVPDEPYCPVCDKLDPHPTAIEAGVYDPASCPSIELETAED